MKTRQERVMSAKEVISENVHDGDTLITGNYTISVAFLSAEQTLKTLVSGLINLSKLLNM
jgi:hypothetical protein